jgi:hypothetical protein
MELKRSHKPPITIKRDIKATSISLYVELVITNETLIKEIRDGKGILRNGW